MKLSILNRKGGLATASPWLSALALLVLTPSLRAAAQGQRVTVVFESSSHFTQSLNRCTGTKSGETDTPSITVPFEFECEGEKISGQATIHFPTGPLSGTIDGNGNLALDSPVEVKRMVQITGQKSVPPFGFLDRTLALGGLGCPQRTMTQQIEPTPKQWSVEANCSVTSLTFSSTTGKYLLSGTEVRYQGGAIFFTSGIGATYSVGSGAPAISLDPTEVGFDVEPGVQGPPPKTATLANSGQGTLIWQATATTESGGNWLKVTLESDLEGTEYELNSHDIPGGERFWFRVVATDGMNVAAAEAGPIQVVKKGPRIFITDPQEGVVIPIGSSLTLEASGYDLEDGALQEQNLQWSSDRAGALGTGSRIHVENLLPGTHRITLVGQDKDANRSQTSINIEIRDMVPDIEFSQHTLGFGDVVTGQSRDLPLTVRNVGTAELRIQSIGVNSPFALVSPPVPFTLAAGATQTLTFRFAPTVPRSETSVALITSNDLDEGNVNIALTGTGSSDASTAKQAQASLHCLSLRFQRAAGTVFGESFELELTSLSVGDPANGELFPAFPPNYASGFILKGEALADPLNGNLTMQIPKTGDSNGNDLDDFFEVNRGVNATTTTGDYTSDFDKGTVKATWSRTAGSKTGSCRLELRGDLSGLEADFTVTFELLEYAGPFDYVIGSDAVKGNLKLARVPSGPESISGSVTISRVSPTDINHLDIADETWTDATGRKLEMRALPMNRSATAPKTYSADIFFQDGDPGTAGEDYLDWMLVITDPNDSDGDGITDLSDQPAGGPPTSRFISIRFDNAFLVITWQGTGRLQSAVSVTGPWNNQPFTESPARITPTERQQFFRLVQQ